MEYMSSFMDSASAAPIPYTISIFAISAILLFIYKLLTDTDIPFIPHIPEIPHALPITGHLTQLGADHATICEKWWRKYGHSVFQIRLGNTRAVIFNSFDDCKKVLTQNPQGLIDRPKLFTFHGVISSTQGFTIGSSPWDSSCRNKRKAASTTLSKNMMKSYHEMFDLESFCIVRDLHRDTKSPVAEAVEVSIRPYIQRYALNTTLTLCYGIRMDAVYDDLLREILHVGSAISLLRSASENYQDYVPILRYLPGNEKNKRSKELRDRRDKYLNELLDKVKKMIETGTEKPCISAAILKDEETRLSGVEVSSICLSLVSGGFETIPGTLVSCIGSLCTVEGIKFQERAFEEIRKVYPDLEDAWGNDFEKEDVPYLNAIVKEAGRYYTVSNMSLPRKTMSDVRWGDAVIPKGTMVLINAQAGNHDVDYWGADAGIFNPERWLDPPSSPTSLYTEKPTSSTPHLSFGAGSRSCPGAAIASKLINAALFRIISLYKIEASVSDPPNTDYVDYNAIKSALVAIPRDFKVKLTPRDGTGDLARAVLRNSEERTKNFYKE